MLSQHPHCPQEVCRPGRKSEMHMNAHNREDCGGDRPRLHVSLGLSPLVIAGAGICECSLSLVILNAQEYK